MNLSQVESRVRNLSQFELRATIKNLIQLEATICIWPNSKLSLIAHFYIHLYSYAMKIQVYLYMFWFHSLGWGTDFVDNNSWIIAAINKRQTRFSCDLGNNKVKVGFWMCWGWLCEPQKLGTFFSIISNSNTVMLYSIFWDAVWDDEYFSNCTAAIV